MSDNIPTPHYCTKCSQPALYFCNNCGGWFCPLHGTPGSLDRQDPPGGLMGRTSIPSACWRDGGYDADVDGPLPLEERVRKQRERYYEEQRRARERAEQQARQTTTQETSTEPPTRTETTGTDNETGDTPGHPGKQGV